MNTPSSRTFTNAAILLGVGLFALGTASLIPPLRSLERFIVKRVAVKIDPVDTILDGQGSQESPWTRRKAVPPVVPPPPRILTIDEDPEKWFSASPLAPIDHAGILRTLADGGHKVIGIGTLMAWDEPRSLELDGLRMELDRYEAPVLALPLARGAAPEPVASPFLRWSIPADQVKGKVSSLPQVNRVSISNAELGGKKALAGFSLLENETDPGDGKQALLAQWGDRVIFSFPLAVEIAAQGVRPADDPVIAAQGLKSEDVLIDVGHEIRLGIDGPVIPIDGFGRGGVMEDVRALEAPALRLIYEKNSLPPMAEPLVTRDVRADLPPAEKAWSDRLAASVQALRQAQRFQEAVILPRPEPLTELALILGMVFFGTWATCQRSIVWRVITSLMLAGLGAQLLYLFASRQNLWLPPLAILSPGLTALGLAFVKRGKVVAPAAEVPVTVPAVETHAPAVVPAQGPVAVVEPEPEVVYESAEEWAEPDEIPAEGGPVRKPARKAAAKKAAKKAATKAPAKKAAKKAPAKKAAKRASPKKADDDEGARSSGDETES